MTADERREVVEGVQAVLAPRLVKHTRKFQKTLSDIKFGTPGVPSYQLDRAAKEAASEYVSKEVSLVAGAIGEALEAMGVDTTDDERESLLKELLSADSEARKFIYDNGRGLGFEMSGDFDWAIGEARRLGVDEEIGKLKLLAARVRRQVKSGERRVSSNVRTGIPAPELVVALDTQMLLEFEHLNHLKPSDFGADDAAHWLITGWVEREISMKKAAPDGRVQRRARSVDRLLDDRSLQVFRYRPGGAFDYGAHSLDPRHHDEAIVGELISFRYDYPDSKIIVVSDDGGFRRLAIDHGFDVVEPDQNLRRKPDALEEENRALRERIVDLQKTAPSLAIKTNPQPIVATICDSLLDTEVDAAVARQMGALAPEVGSELHTRLGRPIGGPLGVPNPDYASHRLLYEGKFREYYVARHRIERRRVDIDLTLENNGQLPAEKIDIEVTVPRKIGSVFLEFPDRPEFPDPPATHKIGSLPYINEMMRKGNFSISPSPFIRAVQPDPNGSRLIHKDDGSTVVRIWRVLLAQKRSVGLSPFYIILDDAFASEGIQLDYEIRSSAPGVTSGVIRVKIDLDAVPPIKTPIFTDSD